MNTLTNEKQAHKLKQLLLTRGERWAGKGGRKGGMNIYTRIYVNSKITKDLLLSTGNPTHQSVINYMGKESEK